MFVLVFLGAVNAEAQEKHLKKSELPSAVQKTVDEQSKGAEIRGYASELEGGQLQYEVEMTLNGLSRDVSTAPDGSVLEVEQQVVLESLPEAVRQGLQKAAGAGTITKVESLTKHGTLVAYEAQVQTGSKHSEIQVGSDGQPLAHPE